MTERKEPRFQPLHKHMGKLIFSKEFTIKNISDTGLCLLTSQHINTNTIYKIELLNNEKKKALLKVEALWSMLRGTRKENNDMLPVYEVGLQFIEMNDEEKNFLKDFIVSVSNNPDIP